MQWVSHESPAPWNLVIYMYRCQTPERVDIISDVLIIVQLQVKAPKERKLFNTRSFMEEHGLGPPIHVDWFVSSAPHEEE